MKYIMPYKLFESNTELTGKIVFDPTDYTKKHRAQASWKKMAMVQFSGDVAEYYAWLVKKRYNLELNRPLRGAHISFINDSMRDIKAGLGGVSDGEAEKRWQEIKEQWDGVEVPIKLDTSPQTNGKHWWLIIPHDEREGLHGIRAQLGLGRPHWGLHMSIGYANEKNIDHSRYIASLLKKSPGYL